MVQVFDLGRETPEMGSWEPCWDIFHWELIQLKTLRSQV
jgi:hypothetical protein